MSEGGIPEIEALLARAAAGDGLHVDAERVWMTLPGLGAFGTPAIDLASHPERRRAVLEVLGRHGIDAPEGGTIRITDPVVQAEILQALQGAPAPADERRGPG